ncbi:MAG: DUF2059 domain-containing protein [Candidatus Desulfofervidaceae bacterium]|nr:DUF2059 domain-containing protein [Candidatus Desulfofervidaceae bacterium]
MSFYKGLLQSSSFFDRETLYFNLSCFLRYSRKGTFYDTIYPIYHKYLTLEDIRELIAFYKTPVGQKIITIMPQLTQGSILAGQLWEQSLEPVIQQRIKKRFEWDATKILLNKLENEVSSEDIRIAAVNGTLQVINKWIENKRRRK